MLEASGSAASSGQELLAFYPAARIGAPVVDSTGLEDVRVAPAPGGNAYVLGRATGGAWSISARP